MSDRNLHVVIINKSEKNSLLGAFLGLFFGFIGLLYSTQKGALIMFVATVLSICLIPLMIGIPMLIMCQVVNAVWGYIACEAFNKAVMQSTQEAVASKAA